MKKILIIFFITFNFLSIKAQNKNDISSTDYKLYIDSVFNAELSKGQIKDSTLLDKINFHFYNATESFLKTDYNSALQELSICINLSSTSDLYYKEYAAANYLLYRTCLQKEDWQNAYKFINIANIYNPKNTTYLKELSLFLFSFEDYTNSIKFLEKLNKLVPNNAEYINLLCQVYIEDKKYNKALKQLEYYQHLEGNNVNVLSKRAEIYQEAGKPDKAIKQTLKYIKDHPEDYFDASLLLFQTYNINHDTISALKILDDIDNKYPNNSTVLLTYAKYYKEQNNDSLNEKYIFDAISTKEIMPEYAANIIRPVISEYVQMQDTSKIKVICDSLEILYPEQPPIISLKADIYKSLKDTILWKENLLRLRSLVDNEDVDFQLLTIAEQQQKNDELRCISKKGYEKYNNDKWAFYRVISLIDYPDQDSIINVSKTLIPTISTPKIKSSIYQILGDIYYSTDINTAIEMYDSCLVYDPKNAGALNNLAYNLTKMENPDLKRAEKLAANAIEIDPENIYVIDTYAWILFLRGDNFLSEFYFEKLMRIENEKGIESSIETLYHIGCLYIKTNRIKFAKEKWMKALEIYDSNPNEFKDIEIISSMRNFIKQNYENK